MAGNGDPSGASARAVQRSIPNKFVRVTVGTSASSKDLAALDGVDEAGDAVTDADLTGRYVFFQVPSTSPGTVTMLRGTHASIASGKGILLAVGGEPQEFDVPSSASRVTTLALIASAADSFLDILYDDEI